MDVCLFSNSITQRAKTESYRNNVNETRNLKVICRKNESIFWGQIVILESIQDFGRFSKR